MDLEIIIFTAIAVGCAIGVVAFKREGRAWQCLFFGMMTMALGLIIWDAEAQRYLVGGGSEPSLFSYGLMGVGFIAFIISFFILAVEEFKDFLGKNQE